MTYTNRAKRAMLSTSPEERVLELIEITHPDLAVPARFVNDKIDIMVEGHRFYATSFRLIRPDDVDQQTPQAKLSVDNIGRELTQWLEASNGGKGAKCRILAVLRSSYDDYATGYFAEVYTQPSVPAIEFDMTLDLTGVSADLMEVSGGLGFQNTLMQPAVAMRYDPITSPAMW